MVVCGVLDIRNGIRRVTRDRVPAMTLETRCVNPTLQIASTPHGNQPVLVNTSTIIIIVYIITPAILNTISI